MWSKEKSLFLSLVLTKAAIVLVGVCCVLAPYLVKLYDTIQVRAVGFESVYVQLLVTLYITAVIAFLALFSLNGMLDNIKKGNVFVMQNVKILRVISYCCFGVGATFLFFGFFKPIALVIAVIAAFFGLVLRVLKNVFVKAIELREENDFTI